MRGMRSMASVTFLMLSISFPLTSITGLGQIPAERDRTGTSYVRTGREADRHGGTGRAAIGSIMGEVSRGSLAGRVAPFGRSRRTVLSAPCEETTHPHGQACLRAHRRLLFPAAAAGTAADGKNMTRGARK